MAAFIQLHKMDNGWLVEEFDEEQKIVGSNVFETPQFIGETDPFPAERSMLWHLISLIDCRGSKWDKYRLTVGYSLGSGNE